MSTADLIELVRSLGAPIIFSGLAFWFILYQYDQSTKERIGYIERDEANDKRAFAQAERSNETMNKLSKAVDLNTKAVKQLVSLLERKG